MGRNDDAWAALFQRYRILEQVQETGRFQISAQQIKEYREPRLMTKFDHQVNLPSLFRENGLAVLPISRGDYIISSFAAYHAFEASSGECQQVSIPLWLQSLLPQFLVSETIALNCACASGILADFLGEEGLISTVSGRMGSGSFAFGIQTVLGRSRIEVNNAQIEIDAAYEGPESLALFEAKRDLAEDFLVRQLYYPYRVWRGRVSKRVRPVFLTFANGVFQLYEYTFADPEDYNALQLVRQKSYVIRTDITQQDLWELLQSVRPEPEPEVPFPQADSLPRLLNLTELLSQGELTREEITEEYAFDVRQTNYYTDAGRYLGLMEKRRENGAVFFRLTERGKTMMAMSYRERMLATGGAILRHQPFREVFRLRLERGALPERTEILCIMRSAGLYHVDSEATLRRRASTVASWCSWLADLC